MVFYDLLPYGMRFDPSQEVRAGRITSLSGSYQSQPGSWDKSQVKVTVDSEKDIIENYRGTGRTMVIFHIHYDGADAAVYTSQKWMEGWGVSFQAYYDWKDLGVAQEGSNISAFMPEDAADHPMYLQPLYGEDGEVYRDDGTVPSEEYAPFNGGDLNKDGITDIANVLMQRRVPVRMWLWPANPRLPSWYGQIRTGLAYTEAVRWWRRAAVIRMTLRCPTQIINR